MAKPSMVELSLAPMMKVTTPQFRSLLRKISPEIVLFSEMISSSAVVRLSSQKLADLLGKPDEKTVIQVGGSNPEEISDCISILKENGWQEFNLNCGCPSEKVQKNKIGAVLMLEPDLVAEIINTVYKRTGCILSLKIRTGVDEHDSYEFLSSFVNTISTQTPCQKFYIHARKCWLSGLNPKQNRNIPPLNYESVYRLKTDHPNLFISLNGGINEKGMDKLQNLDGLMIGRHACKNMNIFNEISGKPAATNNAITEYFSEIPQDKIITSKETIPLMNITRGTFNSKSFKQLLDKLIKDKVTSSEGYKRIREFLESVQAARKYCIQS